MFQNYSQTYAATITTVAGLASVLLSKYGVTEADATLVIGTIVSFVGIVWQIVHRFKKGDVTVGGMRKS